MCGRFSLVTDMSRLEARFGFDADGLLYRPSFNVAPTQEILTVVNDAFQNQPRMMKWGLLPYWYKGFGIGSRMINARAETLTDKPGFRQAFRDRRCLIIADGFYEWKKSAGKGVPMRIALGSGEPFGFAGLWEAWQSPAGEVVYSCAIITTGPNSVMASIHDRMPVILPRESEAYWLDHSHRDFSSLRMLLQPYVAGTVNVFEISTLVNSPSNDTCDVIVRVK
jgi:putative SOS response-associated peptidase YedK